MAISSPDVHLVRRNVDLASVDLNMAVTHQLASLAAGNSKSEAVDNVVQAPFQLLQAAVRR